MRSQTYILYSRMAFFEIEWAPQRPVAAPPACPRPPRGHGTSPRPSGMLGSSITPFTRAVLRRASRRAAQRSAQTTKQIRRRPWRHPLSERQPRKGHSLAGKDYGQHRQQQSWRSVSPPAVASRPQRHGRDGPGAARLDEIDEEDEDEDEDEERTTRTWTRTQARRRTRRSGREARTMTR